MVRRKRLKRGGKIGSWKIQKTLNPPWEILARMKWKKLPKEAFAKQKKGG